MKILEVPFFFVIVIIGLILFNIINDRGDVLYYCNRLGYDNFKDYMNLDGDMLGVECENKTESKIFIINKLSQQECIKYDKWNQCIQSRYVP